MKKNNYNYVKFGLTVWLSLLLAVLVSPASAALTKGIYLTQETLEDTTYLKYLIKHAKASGINTFIIDMEIPSKRYQQNIALVKENDIKYVARITVFPGGGTPSQIDSMAHREKKYNLIKAALGYGANEIQLDYIRYNTKQPASSQHAVNINKIIQWYKDRLVAQKIPLQVDIFGIASFGEEKHIGHNIKLFSSTVDAICPMVYPSHYSPFPKHFATPYQTVYDSLVAIQDQFDDEMPVKLYPYIELSNYHYPLSHEKKVKYIYAQIQAVQDAGADGWYAWSPNNYYDTLFNVLETHSVK
ncbi:MAG: putative glycoside hydrolase [Gammaproteobacteria bacterium]